MFHVKRLFIFRKMFVFMLGLALTAGAQAEIFKCTDAQGQITIGDQPCNLGQKGGAVKVVPQTGSSQKPTAARDQGKSAAYNGVGSDAEVQKYRTELLQSLSPECQNLARRYLEFVESKNPSAPLTDTFLAEYQAKCEAPIRAFVEKRNAAMALAAQRKYECDAKKSVLDDKRPKFAQLDEQGRRAFTTIEQEYSSKCK